MPEKILTTDHEEVLDEGKKVLKPERILLPDGREAEAFMMGDAALYLGMGRANLNQVLGRLERDGRPVQVYRKTHGGIGRYLLKRDLDDLRRVEPVNTYREAQEAKTA